MLARIIFARGIIVNPIAIIGSLFFIFGFITWLNAVLIPYLKIACELTIFQSYLVAFAFYIAYLIMALPSGWVLCKIGFKNAMVAGLHIMALGAGIFIPTAMKRLYSLFLLGLFVQGTGLALLQTASNPYVTVLGSRGSAARRISIMGICSKVAGAIAPLVLAAITLQNADALIIQLQKMTTDQGKLQLDALAMRVIEPYFIMTLLLVLLAILIYFSSLPEVDTNNEDEKLSRLNINITSVLQFPHLLMGGLAIFLYIGAEVIAGDTIISYGISEKFTLSSAKYFTTYTLISMLVGYVVGIICIPKYFTQEKALGYCAFLGTIFSFGAILIDGYASVMFIALLGLANSLIWPALWPLALADLGKFTKSASSLLIMGLSGGALIPLAYGHLANVFTPRHAYIILIPIYIFIFYYATKGYKARKI